MPNSLVGFAVMVSIMPLKYLLMVYTDGIDRSTLLVFTIGIYL